ncbi:MAG: redoxin domain-containing protein [Acidobacteria bacterium]|nr:redoxin domain-containing protein [Acidobacteriota bacterium]
MANKLYDIPVSEIDGTETTLAEFEGKVLLLVNVASKCGLTPQYAGIEKLYKEYKDQGFEVLGFPANNFLAQEPGTSEEIQDFCQTNYDVTFPLFQKISVKGEDQHPLYSYLTAEKGEADIANGSAFEERLASIGQPRAKSSDILWNFEKFMIGKDGSIAARIAPDVTAEDERVVAALKAELAK